MAVVRGQRILRSDMDGLAASANSRGSLEGKPYRFLPRVWIINDNGLGPPGNNQGQGAWGTSALNRLAGIQVGDVVANIRRPHANAGLGMLYGDIYQLQRLPVGGILNTVGADWVSLKNASSAWRIVHDFQERDSNAVTNPALPTFGYGLLTAGTIANGTVIVVVDNLNGATQGTPDNWNLNNLRPVLQVRRDNAWHTYTGWNGELNRMRFAIGRRYNSIDQTAAPGSWSPSRRALVPAPYQAQSLALQFNPSANFQANLNREVRFYYPSDFELSWTRKIAPPLTYDASGPAVKSGFVSQATGPLKGVLYTNASKLNSDQGNTFILGGGYIDLVSALHFNLFGPLVSAVRSVTLIVPNYPAGIIPPGYMGQFFRIEFDGVIGPGEQWLSYTLTVDATAETHPPGNFWTGIHFEADPGGPGRVAVGLPDGKLYKTYPVFFNFFNEAVPPFELRTEYGVPVGVAAALHTRKSVTSISFADEELQTSRLPGSVPTAGEPIAVNENMGDIRYYYAHVSGPAAPDTADNVVMIAGGVPISSNVMEPSVAAIPRPIRQFAPHQFDYVPPAGEIVTQGKKGIYRRVVSTQSRGPYLWPNADGSPTDNQPSSIACRTYPTVRDPIEPANYQAFSNLIGFGQIIYIKAIRRGEDFSIVRDLGTEAALGVDVGCYRAGEFVSLAHITIPFGKAVGTWKPAAGEPGIPVFEFFPLVVKCDSEVMVYPTWFHTGARTGLGDGVLREGVLTAAAPPIMADHYNDTATLLDLLQ